jgi:division/cell wall cluster transcriptional repressor MraZ
VFLGTFTPKLDDKGRLTLPAKFRDELAGGLMITKSQDHSLAIYPRDEFVKLARKAAAAPRNDPAARAYVRALAAGKTLTHFPSARFSFGQGPRSIRLLEQSSPSRKVSTFSKSHRKS